MVPIKNHPIAKTIHKPTKPVALVKPKYRYTEAIGRRKTAMVRVRVYEAKHADALMHGIVVNDKKYEAYFPLKREQKIAAAPLTALSLGEKDYAVSVHAKGGGVNAQAEAVCLGLARALIAIDPTRRTKLKALGFLKRDPRMVERKKYGSRKARRPQQWRKR